MYVTTTIHLRLDLERAMARLTRKQRLALWLWLQGYTQAEIAESHGVTQQAVCDRIQRARSRIAGETL